MKKSYYAIIPADVRYDKRLTPNAKLLYGEITALCNEKGFCWANNSYFAKLYEVSNKSISTWISQLAEFDYVKTQLIYREGSKEVKERRVYLANAPMEEKFHTPGKKVPEGGEEKFHTPMEEKVKDNNTSFNNTMNTTTNTELVASISKIGDIVDKFQGNGFGLINLYTSERLIELSETYTEDWLMEALDIAIDNNKRNIGYTEAILKRWQTEGKSNIKKQVKKYNQDTSNPYIPRNR